MDLVHSIYLREILEILILAVIFYRLILLIQGTRAMQMLAGLSLIMLLAFAALKLGLHTINWIFSNFFSVIVLAVIILFQPELRRALANVGRARFFQGIYSTAKAHMLEELVRSATSLAAKRIGALITLQRETELSNYIEGGTILDARLSREILMAIFLPNSPIHDGSVVIKEDRIVVAGAFLPISLDPGIPKELGTRHRAAIGVSEETDAVAIVVSEERGTIAMAVEGQLHRDLDANGLRDHLQRFFVSPSKE
jgi:diadenylate cyclase